MKTIICLVRHGKTAWNEKLLIQGRKDIPLDDEGIKQIYETANRLKEIPLDFNVFISSPLSRAVKSCAIIKEVLRKENLSTIIEPAVIEREFGEADGLKITEDIYQKILKNEYQGMETSTDIQKRATLAINKIVSTFEGQNILIVSHSHFIKGYLTTLDPSLNFQMLLKNGCLTFLVFEGSKLIDYQYNI